MKKVLLTGANGFIGRHCVDKLVSQGFQVHIVSRSFGQRTGDGTQSVISHACDLFDSAQQEKLLAEVKPNYLLHLAWYTEHGLFWSSLENLRWVAASLELFRNFADNGGQRAVIAGTCAEYEWGGEGLLSENQSKLKPSTLYGKSKLALSQILEEAAKQLQISLSWGRIFFLYGPHEGTKRLVPSVINSLLRNEPVPCTHGEQIRDFMHVEDVARAFSELLDSDHQGPINIASGEGVQLRRVIGLIGEMLGNPNLIRFGERPVSPDEPQVLVADTSVLRDKIGFRSQYPLAEGLEATLEWWKNRADTLS